MTKEDKRMNEKAKELMGKEKYDINDLKEIMKLLRSPRGCPWDIEQTHESIRNNFIEETYEAVEAIDNHSVEGLREELGDVLLQVVFHCRISEENGEFNFDDVSDEICRKLIIRHPHVFGEVNVKDSADVLTNWDAIKKQTKKQKTDAEVLESVAKTLPSLMRAAKLAKKAEKAGLYSQEDIYFDTSEDDIKDKAGKQLFEIAASLNKHGIEPEQLLYDYCEKFVNSVKSAE